MMALIRWTLKSLFKLLDIPSFLFRLTESKAGAGMGRGVGGEEEEEGGTYTIFPFKNFSTNDD